MVTSRQVSGNVEPIFVENSKIALKVQVAVLFCMLILYCTLVQHMLMTKIEGRILGHN
jgi:hypothetical protein